MAARFVVVVEWRKMFEARQVCLLYYCSYVPFQY